MQCFLLTLALSIFLINSLSILALFFFLPLAICSQNHTVYFYSHLYLSFTAVIIILKKLLYVQLLFKNYFPLHCEFHKGQKRCPQWLSQRQVQHMSGHSTNDCWLNDIETDNSRNVKRITNLLFRISFFAPCQANKVRNLLIQKCNVWKFLLSQNITLFLGCVFYWTLYMEHLILSHVYQSKKNDFTYNSERKEICHLLVKPNSFSSEHR